MRDSLKYSYMKNALITNCGKSREKNWKVENYIGHLTLHTHTHIAINNGDKKMNVFCRHKETNRYSKMNE